MIKTEQIMVNPDSTVLIGIWDNSGNQVPKHLVAVLYSGIRSHGNVIKSEFVGKHNRVSLIEFDGVLYWLSSASDGDKVEQLFFYHMTDTKENLIKEIDQVVRDHDLKN